MKNNILFIATVGDYWLGGVYYVKNALYTLFEEKKIDKHTNITILVSSKNFELFQKYASYDNIKIITYKDFPANNFIKTYSRKILKKIIDIPLITICQKYKIEEIYPVEFFPYFGLENKCVYWIPDFQHIKLPKLFTKEEMNYRNKRFKFIAKNHKTLILSSKDAYATYKELYPKYTNGINILSFMSDIGDDIKKIDTEMENDVINKYNLPNKYVFIANQFMLHKNHLTAFKAVNLLVNTMNINIVLICTGNKNDYRDKEGKYYNSLLDYINQNNLENNIRILGVIPRVEQLTIMKLSKVVIQPSLFEGWGTTVEDAKVLGKKIILSDIDVHYEQGNSDCYFFDRNDCKDLANNILKILS